MTNYLDLYMNKPDWLRVQDENGITSLTSKFANIRTSFNSDLEVYNIKLNQSGVEEVRLSWNVSEEIKDLVPY